jgi:hypothetical protein
MEQEILMDTLSNVRMLRLLVSTIQIALPLVPNFVVGKQ